MLTSDGIYRHKQNKCELNKHWNVDFGRLSTSLQEDMLWKQKSLQSKSYTVFSIKKK